MTVTLRKERERAEREKLILTHGQQLLLEKGFQDLNLDELARRIEYSKGTIYQHFISKEDLALGVATEALKQRADLFERAAAFRGRSRERARAIGFACCEFMVAHPDYFCIEQMLKSTSFWEKASESQRHANAMAAGRTFRAVHRVVMAGLESGDLPPHPTITPEHIAFSMAAITMGSHMMSQVPELVLLAGITNPVHIVRANQDVLLDGYQWKPLFRDFDYQQTDQRIKKEIFPEANWLL